MPYKDINKRREYDKNRKRRIRNVVPNEDALVAPILENVAPNENPVVLPYIQEFKQRAILPRHIYEYRQVMKQMLKEYFRKKVLKVYDRTDLIVTSILSL